MGEGWALRNSLDGWEEGRSSLGQLRWCWGEMRRPELGLWQPRGRTGQRVRGLGWGLGTDRLGASRGESWGQEKPCGSEPVMWGGGGIPEMGNPGGDGNLRGLLSSGGCGVSEGTREGDTQEEAGPGGMLQWARWGEARFLA